MDKKELEKENEKLRKEFLYKVSQFIIAISAIFIGFFCSCLFMSLFLDYIIMNLFWNCLFIILGADLLLKGYLMKLCIDWEFFAKKKYEAYDVFGYSEPLETALTSTGNMRTGKLAISGYCYANSVREAEKFFVKYFKNNYYSFTSLGKPFCFEKKKESFWQYLLRKMFRKESRVNNVIIREIFQQGSQIYIPKLRNINIEAISSPDGGIVFSTRGIVENVEGLKDEK